MARSKAASSASDSTGAAATAASGVGVPATSSSRKKNNAPTKTGGGSAASGRGNATGAAASASPSTGAAAATSSSSSSHGSSPAGPLGTLAALLSPYVALLSSHRRRLVYRLLGPTPRHLRHEFSLLLSLSVLTLSSLVGLYRASFGAKPSTFRTNTGVSGGRDVKYVLVVSLWLSRHLWLRLLCTTDRSTSSSPSLRGLAAQLLGRYCTGGQYFDPTGAARGGMELAGMGGGGGAGGGGGGADGGDRSGFARFQRKSALAYVWFFGPMGRMFEMAGEVIGKLRGRDEGTRSSKRGGGDNRLSSSERSQQSSKSEYDDDGSRSSGGPMSSVQSTALYRSLDRYYGRYSLPGQMCIYLLVLAAIAAGVIAARNMSAARYDARGSAAGYPGAGGAFHPHETLHDALGLGGSGGVGGGLQGSGGAAKQLPVNPRQQQGGQGQRVTQREGDDPFAGGGSYWGSPHRAGGGNPAGRGLGPGGRSAPSYSSSSSRGGGGGNGWWPFFTSPPFPPGGPTTPQLLFHVGWIGTLLSMLLYGRALPPLPDLLASANSPAEAAKAEARRAAVWNPMWGGGTSGERSSKKGRGGGGGSSSQPAGRKNVLQRMLSAFHLGPTTAFSSHPSVSLSDASLRCLPWSERYRSASSAYRFRLWGEIGLFRLLEALILVVLIPHSTLGCLLAGHCTSSKPSAFDLPGWTGIGNRLGDGGGGSRTAFGELVRDPAADWAVAISVVLVTVCLVACQSVAVDRSYLGALAYVSSVGDDDAAATGADGEATSGAGASVHAWGSSHGSSRGGSSHGGGGTSKGKKSGGSGGGGGDFDLLSSAPDYRHPSPYVRLCHRAFRSETGHPSSSKLAAMASQILTVHAFVLFCVTAVRWYRDEPWRDCTSLMLTTAAVMYAAEGAANGGMADFGELRGIAEEMCVPLGGVPRKKE